MTRLGANEHRNGRIWSGFDYALQAWVLEEFIQPCGVAAVVWEEGGQHFHGGPSNPGPGL